MADDTNDTRREIDEEDSELRQKERQLDPESQDRDKFADAESGDPGGGKAEGIFAHDGEGVTGEALGGGPLGTGNTGAELPGGAQSEFARTSGGQTGGMHETPGGGEEGSPSGVTGEMVTGTSGAAGSASGGAGGQSVGTVGTIGGAIPQSGDQSTTENEYGAQHETVAEELGEDEAPNEPLGADHQHGAKGGSVVSAGGNSTGPGPGQTGTDRDE